MRFLMLVLFAAALAGCMGGKGELPVAESSFDGEWPLNVSAGTIRCGDGTALLFEAGNATYALNGVATQQGYDKIDRIWRSNPDIPGTKIPLRDLIDTAKRHC